MAVPRLLLETLEDLLQNDLLRFQWELVNNVARPIPRCRLEQASHIDTVDVMIQFYGEETAVDVTVEILKEMGNNNAAQKLKNKYAAR